MQNFKQVKKIFFVGIGGIGISALAKLFSAYGRAAEGWKISGSDKYSSEITESLKRQRIRIYIGHKEKNLDFDTDLVIYSPAVQQDVPERKKAAELGIKQLSYPAALGLISREKYTIAISGTHGKSTTTVILGLILDESKFSPTVIVGSKAGPFKYGNLKIGKSKYFVVEACEWRAHMLELKPKIIILTNLEEDHLDYYKTFKNLKNAFKEYVKKLPKSGLLVVNGDDKTCLEISKSTNAKVVTYGMKNKKVHCRAENVGNLGRTQRFDLIWQNKNLGKFSLRIPGQFNIYNSLAAAACALKLGAKTGSVKAALAGFGGIWRRFERVGTYKGALIFSDYAHHPTAIRETLKAAKEFYPHRRLVILYQPHHFDRTKRLFKKFSKAFDLADLVILNEVYDVPGREVVKEISSRDLAKELKKRSIKTFFAKNINDAKTILSKNIRKEDIVLIVGAGDIYNIIHKIV